MSIFNYKGNCPICEKEVNFMTMSTIKYHKANLCQDCVKKITTNGGISQLKKIDQKDIEYLRGLVSDKQDNSNVGPIKNEDNSVNKTKNAKKSPKNFFVGLIIVVVAIAVLANVSSGKDDDKNPESTTQDTVQSETNSEDNDFFTTDKDQQEADSIKKDFGIETTDKLRELGFTVDEATSIYNIFVQIGVNQISEVQTAAGTGIDNLQSFVAIANNDKDLKFYFTVEKRELYYAGFRDDALFDSTKGGVLKNIGDVHIPETKVDLNTYSQLQVLAQDLVKQYLKYPNTAEFPLYDSWGVGRSDNNYQIYGKVTAKNGYGVESEMHFSVWLLKNNDNFEVEAIVIDDVRVK